MLLQVHISTVLIHSGLLFTPSWADIVFSDDSDDGGSRPGSQGCSTVGGPGAGSPCQFPFIYKEVSRDGCITEADPDGKAWCSTKVDSDGVHVTNGQHWAHCSQQCPLANIQQSSSASSSSAFTVEPQLCQTKTGAEGTCRLPATCIGATIQFLEDNECQMIDGSIGTCCVPIPIDNIINIIDSPQQTVDIPINLDIDQVESIVPRFDFGIVNGGAGVRSNGDKVRFASEEPAEDVEVDTNFVDDPTPSDFQLRFNTPRADIIKLDEVSNIFLAATNTIKTDNNLTDLQAAIGLRNGFNSDTSSAIKERCPWVPAPTCNQNLVFRTFDGSCNNLKNPNFGRTGTPYQRILLPEYAPGTLDLPRKSTAGNIELPSARKVSNALSVGTNVDDSDNTNLVMQMGQFIDHDITHTPNNAASCCGRNGAFPATFDAEKCAPIRMFSDDPFWKGRKTCMNFARSLSSPGLKCELSTREQLNQITHWIDGSNIYGSTLEEARYLIGDRGKLKMSSQSRGRTNNLPSCAGEQKGKVTGCDVCGSKRNDCFFAGDFRVNEQLNLIVLHTLFMREHNRIATQLASMNPSWTDDKIYQEARKINVAEYQHIIFKEWLPIIIGNTFMKSYGLFPRESGFSTDYSDSFDPRINNEFAGAAFRFGHSMVPGKFSSKSRGRSETPLQLSQTFFKPADMKKTGFMDGLVRGMAEQGSKLWDNSFVEDIRDHLFESRPGRGGLDLVAVNIQRGRDHGLPGYNKYKEICTGERAKNFDDLRKIMDAKHIAKLKTVYRHVDDIDLYVGGFLEAAHEDSILGPVFKCIIGDQFARLKKGDRFFYDLGVDNKIAFSLSQLNEVRKTSMARIICDNTDEIDSIQPLAFKLQTPTGTVNAVRSCSENSIPKVNLEVFKESQSFGR